MSATIRLCAWVARADLESLEGVDREAVVQLAIDAKREHDSLEARVRNQCAEALERLGTLEDTTVDKQRKRAEKAEARVRELEAESKSTRAAAHDGIDNMADHYEDRVRELESDRAGLIAETQRLSEVCSQHSGRVRELEGLLAKSDAELNRLQKAGRIVSTAERAVLDAAYESVDAGHGTSDLFAAVKEARREKEGA